MAAGPFSPINNNPRAIDIRLKTAKLERKTE
ncbi:protein of unknown function [Candidatus Hydrogenisulfobacillus filiaventi]|uniref:Uncharacterized protein n=1 Tax=Candidatus Hydrogenisulfobacillus filiaventi TaxID=2707344 RepID=A0A6F8ZGM0_9FIRM|nr:protein of unknown function [Candidatus Hydrogenisulfobacillus filiaventi]